MGNSVSTQPQNQFYLPNYQHNIYSQGNTNFKIPDNSGSIDIDVHNLQKCINAGGAASCITNFVQGYDTTDNQFVPSQISNQGFELLENNKTDNSKIFLIIIIILTLLIVFIK
jgi:hypothetical protein